MRLIEHRFTTKYVNLDEDFEPCIVLIIQDDIGLQHNAGMIYRCEYRYMRQSFEDDCIFYFGNSAQVLNDKKVCGSLYFYAKEQAMKLIKEKEESKVKINDTKRRLNKKALPINSIVDSD